MSDDTPALAVGTLVAGKLRVVRALGVGGMGTVYEVEHELTRHRRALKLLHAEFATNAQAVARFLREASAAGRIGSEHIVETFDAGLLESGEPYLVMEMLEGRSLADVLEETGRLPESDAIDWLAQACDGVQAAHDAGIIHRDIKPDNLFIQRSGRVKLLDFGISKFDPALTGEKQLTGDLTLGTPYYMAPEQTTKSGTVDQRADIYALGVVLYECVTGAKPFQGETFPQLVVRIHLGDYEPASSIAGTSAVIDAIIGKAMARKPEDRFPTPASLASALRDVAQATERGQSPFASAGRAPSPYVSTARAQSPFASTERAGDFATVLDEPVHLPTVPPVAVRPSPASASTGNDPTLLSAGSEAPGSPQTVRRPRPWLLVGAALVGAAALGAWWTQLSPGVVAPEPPGLVATSVAPSPAASLPPPQLAPAPQHSEPSAVLVPSAPPILRSAAHATAAPRPSSLPVKSGSRAKEHALEEENPF